METPPKIQGFNTQVRVGHIVPGYAAAISGLIQLGDTIQEIDALKVAETQNLKQVTCMHALGLGLRV
jgi:hypothetical protein